MVFSFQIGKLSPRDVKRFAENCGLNKLKISRQDDIMATAGLFVEGSEVTSTGVGLGDLLALRSRGLPVAFNKSILSSNSRLLYRSKKHDNRAMAP